MTSPLPPAMSAGRNVDPVEDRNNILFNDFDSLGISVPLETTRYAFIGMFLNRALNLKNVNDILEPSASPLNANETAKCIEILPQIAVPPDLWLQPQIHIPFVKLKVSILKEVNTLLQESLDASQSGTSPPFNEASITLLERQIISSNLLEFLKQDTETEMRFDSLNEADEDQNSLEGSSPVLGMRNSLVLELRSFSLLSSNSDLKSGNRTRLSSFSRDLKTSTKKFSFLALPNSKIGPPNEEYKIKTPPQTPPLTSPISNAPGVVGLSRRDSSHSLANGLFAKSRLYGKIKKKRELAALLTSSTTSPAIASPSMSSQRRSSAPDLYVARRGSSQISLTRQCDNQKDKHEYYCQLQKLAAKTGETLKFLNQRSPNASLLHLMEFIKASVFKFVIIDISHMIVIYGHLRVLEPRLK